MSNSELLIEMGKVSLQPSPYVRLFRTEEWGLSPSSLNIVSRDTLGQEVFSHVIQGKDPISGDVMEPRAFTGGLPTHISITGNKGGFAGSFTQSLTQIAASIVENASTTSNPHNNITDELANLNSRDVSRSLTKEIVLEYEAGKVSRVIRLDDGGPFLGSETSLYPSQALSAEYDQLGRIRKVVTQSFRDGLAGKIVDARLYGYGTLEAGETFVLESIYKWEKVGGELMEHCPALATMLHADACFMKLFDAAGKGIAVGVFHSADFWNRKCTWPETMIENPESLQMVHSYRKERYAGFPESFEVPSFKSDDQIHSF